MFILIIIVYKLKTKKKIGLVDETLKAVNNLYDRNFAIMPIKKDSKQGEKKETKKVLKLFFVWLSCFLSK